MEKMKTGPIYRRLHLLAQLKNRKGNSPLLLVLNTNAGSSSDHPYEFLARILTSYSVFGDKWIKEYVPSEMDLECEGPE